jgi:tetratricopeptide (TPR) repeat protein
MAGITLFSIFQIAGWSSDIGMELGWGKCSESVSSGLRVVVAKFDTPADDKFDTRLLDPLKDALQGKASVCWMDRIIQTEEDAVKIAKEQKAAIVIWGNRDDALFQVNISVTGWDLDGIKRNVPQKDVTDFRLYGLDQIPFLTQYVLSNIFFVKGDVSSAIEILDAALISAKYQKWTTEAGMDNPDVYFLLGTFYQDDSQRKTGLENAVNAYTEAIRLNSEFEQAYLNRASVWLELGKYSEAISDCTFLIDNKSFLTPYAYIVRAQVQPNRVESENDFESALMYPIPQFIIY